MDTHTAQDPQNPINWNGTEDIICTLCHNILTDNELEESGDDPNPYCEECTEEQEELANIEKDLNAQKERETLNSIFDAFSGATINAIK
tara:strand:- start:1066 stop:1332 length:267 start_codon:yes stop_codon:yes gene_type:complete